MTEPDTQPTPSPTAAIVRWVVLVAFAFGTLGFGLSWLAGSLDLDSPVSRDLAVAGEAGGDLVAFQLPQLEGGPLLGPPDFRGKVVVVDFWATWCGPCRLQAKFLDELFHELPADQVQFLAVDVGEDEATVRAYTEKTPFPYPVLLDSQDTLSSRYRINGLPTVMVIDPEGRISYQHTGVTPKASLLNRIQEARGQV